MLASDFQQKLAALNHSLHVFCGNDDSKPAGVYFYRGYGEYEEVCGVEKNYVPEFTERYPNGRIKRGGWSRVLKILLNRGLIDRRTSYKYFGHWDEHKVPTFQAETDPILRELGSHFDGEGYRFKDKHLLVDLGNEIRKK